MDIQEIIFGGSGFLVIMMTLIQITPLKINPWSAVGRLIGKAVNKEVMEELKKIKKAQAETQEALDDHIRTDDERNADLHRVYILRFNRELMQEKSHPIPHTREDFIEALHEIDFYERYCREHDEYENNRAVLAIENIKRVYKQKLENHEFS